MNELIQIIEAIGLIAVMLFVLFIVAFGIK